MAVAVSVGVDMAFLGVRKRKHRRRGACFPSESLVLYWYEART